MMDKSAVDPLEREISRVDEKKKVKMSEFLGVMEQKIFERQHLRNKNQIRNKIHLTNILYSMLDRFVPSRSSSKFKPAWQTTPDQSVQPYQKLIASQMFTSQKENQNSSNTFNFHLQTHDQHQNDNSLANRSINPHPEKILDAPELKDDYYLNLLDWSSKDVLAIGLTSTVYLYSPKQIVQLSSTSDDQYVCSLSHHPEGQQISVGLSDGNVQIYDIQTQTLVRKLKGHTNRVSSSAFTYGLLYTGSKDSLVIGHDYRAYHNVVVKMAGHRGQVCGLKHDACGLASGSNDNSCLIWDVNMGKVKHQLLGHKAAVKALAWCPWERNLLVTGGGSTDKTMRFWNTQLGKCVNIVDAESQVCNLLWHQEYKEVISSHGYANNQISIWRVGNQKRQYPICSKVGELYGHKKRVLQMVKSPDQTTLCTASGDETLRFWKLFDKEERRKSEMKFPAKTNLHFCSLR